MSRRFRWVLVLILGVALLALLVRFPWPSTWDSRAPGFLALAFLIVGLAPVIQALRFRYLLGLQMRPPTFSILTEVHYAERFLMPLLPFRMSLPAKALLLHRAGSVGLDVGLSAAILDNALETGVTLGIAAVGAPLLARTTLYLLGAVALGLGVAFVVLTPDRLGRWCSRLRESSRSHRLIAFLKDLRIQAGRMLTNPRFFGLLPFMLLNQLMTLAAMDLLLRSIGYSLSWGMILAIANTGLLLGNATAIPSGWGARELTLTGLLSLAGIPAAGAVWVAVMFRVLTMPPAVVGFIAAARIGWSWGEVRALPGAGVGRQSK